MTSRRKIPEESGILGSYKEFLCERIHYDAGELCQQETRDARLDLKTRTVPPI